MAEYMKLMRLASAHMPIVEENMVRKGLQERATMRMPAMPPQEEQTPDYGRLADQRPPNEPRAALQFSQRAGSLSPQADYAPRR